MLSCQKLLSSKNPSFNFNTHQVKNKISSSSSHRQLLSLTPIKQQQHSITPIKSLHNNHASSSLSSSLPFASSSPHFTSSVGSPHHLSHWNLTSRHITLLNLMACLVAVSATWLFCSAIPTLLAFKRAAESMEKLLDVTREELPDTMASLRLSGMEISDLTMELSDLGQEITKGVKSSTRAVRVAKERLHQLTNMTPSDGQSES